MNNLTPYSGKENNQYTGLQTNPIPVPKDGSHKDPDIQYCLDRLPAPVASSLYHSDMLKKNMHHAHITHIIHRLEARLNPEGIIQILTYSSLLTEAEYEQFQTNPDMHDPALRIVVRCTNELVSKTIEQPIGDFGTIKNTFEQFAKVELPEGYTTEAKFISKLTEASS